MLVQMWPCTAASHMYSFQSAHHLAISASHPSHFSLRYLTIAHVFLLGYSPPIPTHTKKKTIRTHSHVLCRKWALLMRASLQCKPQLRTLCRSVCKLSTSSFNPTVIGCERLPSLQVACSFRQSDLCCCCHWLTDWLPGWLDRSVRHAVHGWVPFHSSTTLVKDGRKEASIHWGLPDRFAYVLFFCCCCLGKVH